MQKNPHYSYVISLAAIFLTGFISASFLVLKPIIVGGLVDDYGFTPSQAGFVAGVEMVGVGIASFIAASLGGKWDRRFIIIAGATLGIVGSVGPALSSAFIPILCFRLMAGFGCGLIAALILTVLGTTNNPDRTLGLYFFTSYIASALLMPLGVWVTEHFHVCGAYLLLAWVLAIAYITAHLIPTTHANVQGHSEKKYLPSFPMVVAALSLGISVFFWISMGALWAFVERIGVQAGIAKAEIGAALSSGQIAAILGALTAAILHVRYNRILLLAASLGLAMISVLAIGRASDVFFFKLGMLVLNFSLPLFLAYLGGTMAALDPAGRVIGLSVTSQTIGMAIGATVGGILAGYFGYISIVLMGLICLAVCFILLIALSAKMHLQPIEQT